MRIVLLKDDIVVNVIEAPEGEYIASPGYAIGAPGGEVGQKWDGGQYVNLAELASSQADLYALLAQLRWQREVSGVSWNGYALPTDRERRSALKDAADKMRDGTLASPISVAFSAEQYAVVTLAQLDEAIGAITHHVQGAFAAALSIASQIGNGTIINKAQVIAAWEQT